MARRLASITTLGLLVAAAAVPASAGAGPAKWTAQVKVARCSHAFDEAVFHARMRRISDAKRMALRFTLLQRTGEEGFLPVAAPKLGRWHRSRIGVAGFGYKQAVRNLAEGSVYRVKVDYRWYDEDGEVLARARRRSPTCPDPAALPNLRVRIVGYRATSSVDTDRYYLKVTNDGSAPAEGVPVRLSVDGTAAGTVTVPNIYAKASKLVTIRAPECGSSVGAEVDPDGLIAETSELDNTHQLACQDLQRR
jgi:CARDB